MDTPGIRELQLAECEQGENETFSEIITLAEPCRFSECSHISEPGCAIKMAIEQETLSLRRLTSDQKLTKEQAFNSATLSEKKQRKVICKNGQ
jgi:ribosome biogenesis GTPase